MRFLTGIYDTPQHDGARWTALLAGATSTMKLLRELSDVLTALPAYPGATVHAGVSFAVLRSTKGLAPGVDVGRVLTEHLRDVEAQLPSLELPPDNAKRVAERLATLIASLSRDVTRNADR